MYICSIQGADISDMYGHWPAKGAKEYNACKSDARKSDRSRQELSNVAKFVFDTAEYESSKVCQKLTFVA